MIKKTFFGKPKSNVDVILYALYINTEKGKKSKWAGECAERIEIDNRINKYIENNDYVSATIICKYKEKGKNCSYNEYVRYSNADR